MNGSLVLSLAKGRGCRSRKAVLLDYGYVSASAFKSEVLKIYNLKVIEYPNGSVQIRLYSQAMGIESDNMTDESLLVVEPFEQTKVKEFNSFNEVENNEEENRRKSLSRTKQMISTYARCYKWEYFVTLTFDPAKVDRTNFKECMGKTRNWLQNIRKRYAPDLKYLIVPELHKDMCSWHLHGLLADTGDIKFVDSGHKDLSHTIFNIGNWYWGFSTVTKVVDTFRIQKYIVKYITKESHALSFGAHRYYVSNNLPKPSEFTMCVEPSEQEEVIEQIAESMGLNVVWKSPTYSTPYTDVTYIELQ